MEAGQRECGRFKKEIPVGILRLDMAKPRRASVDFKFLTQGEPASPQPSVDRLSVTFADDSARSDSSTRCNYYNLGSAKMDKVHFPQGTENAKIAPEAENSDEEDYSASVNAIILRRASTRRSRRRSSRRASSPFSPDILPGTESGRRRSSVFTTSSGDTAITMDDNITGEVTQDVIFENIKLHKEVLNNVKMQPWHMRKKLKLVLQAKNYIKRHEGALQERLAQSHSTRDMLARWNIYLIRKWQRYRREMTNLSNWFIPWELKIKEIESHFGSVVASYFIFLRWLFWVNIVLAIVLISFVAIPEMLSADPKQAGDRKFILAEEKYNSTNFLTLWDFEGVFKYSPLFYGWYTNWDSGMRGYRLPFAYFVTGLVAYAYSFFATLRKMAENSRMSKLSEKDDECIFSWKLFTAWDYMIGNAETAHNRVAAIVVGFKEALLEEAEKKREPRKWKIIVFRILVNIAVLGLLSFSAFAVVMVVKRSTEAESQSTVWRRNEITVVMSLISTFFPMVFEVLGLFEQYHPRKQLRVQLARIMVLNLLNLYSLIFALFDKISDMTTELEQFRNHSLLLSNRVTSPPPLTTDTSLQTYTSVVMECYKNCTDAESDTFTVANMIAALAVNISASTFPLIQKALKGRPATASNVEGSTSFSTEITSSETTTEFYETSTFSYNSTVNETELVESESNFNDFQEAFVDYLTLVLSGFSPNDTYKPNTTDQDFANTTTSSFEFLKTTITPIFDTTESEFEERFETEISTIVDEIATALTSTEKPLFSDKNCIEICKETSAKPNEEISSMPTFVTPETDSFNYSTNSRLRSLCWETMFGQELIKLTVMDLIMTVLSTLAMDFFRGIFVRVMNRCWCWDLEKKYPQYGDFKVAENILHLVNNQGMVWMGLFFSPGLIVINVVKLLAMMYLRAWAVLTCNVPHEIIFRASRSNNFYYYLLLMMLFLCVLPVGYAIVWIRPSWHCGPFSEYKRIFHIFTKTIKDHVPPPIERALDYIASPGIVIPLLVLLILIIYYLISLTGALREANNDLKTQLRRERTEERRKVFQLADKRRRSGSGGSGEFANTPFAKWKKLISTMPEGKSFDDTPKQESTECSQQKEEKHEANKGKDFFSKFMKKALGKSSTSEDDNQNNDDGTDTEQHESLPEDFVNIKEIKPQVHRTGRSSISSGSFDFQRAANVALSKKRNSQVSTDSGERFTYKEPKLSKHHGVLQRRDTLELKKPRKSSIPSSELRQDSISSVWSDNIPVIMISKTESAECLDDQNQKKSVSTCETDSKFKPKVKYALRKQSTEIDEDIICHFNKDAQKIVNVDVKEDAERYLELDKEDLATCSTKSESSEDTTREGSIDTILKSPRDLLNEEIEEEEEDGTGGTPAQRSSNGSSIQTESSSEYNEGAM